MELTIWTYEGPPHVGAMRIAASMRGVHHLLHAPQGDTYADLLFTMIERSEERPPVSYTTFQARDLGGDTAELVKATVAATVARFAPDVLLVGESCTAELIQDQPAELAARMGLSVPVVPLHLPSYSKKENWGAAETFYAIVRALVHPEAARAARPGPVESGGRVRANILGPTRLGFRCRDDVQEVARLLDECGVDVHVVAPLGATAADLRRLPEAHFNVDLYPEVSRTAVNWLQRALDMPATRTVPMGMGATRDFLAEVRSLAERFGAHPVDSAQAAPRAAWYSRSIDSTYLTGKRVFIFGDATHAVAAARIASEEMGFTVVGLGTYSREFAREVRAAAEQHGVEALVTDDYLTVERAIAACGPELVLGTQMERHVAKRLGVPCAVISTPIHVQDVPARYSPVYGREGANVIFDTWVHPLMMGLEEHLLGMFRDDFEFHDGAAPSHLGHAPSVPTAAATESDAPPVTTPGAPVWDGEAEQELRKIPFFVRGRARRNTERYASERGMTRISLETLYDAKAHFSR